MICQHCGNQLPENSKFCLHCGTAVTAAEAAAPGAVGDAAGAAPGAGAAADTSAAPDAASGQAQQAPPTQGLKCPHCGSSDVKQVEGSHPTLMGFVWLPAVVAVFVSFFLGMIVAIFIALVGYAIFFAMYMHGGNALMGTTDKVHYRCSLCEHIFTQ